MSPNSMGLWAAIVAVLTASCSSPAEPPGRAGASFNISGVSPAKSGKACNTTSTTVDIPPPPQVAPSQTVIGDTVTDGQSGAQVSCTVHQSGSGFQVSATLRLGSDAVSVNYTLPSATGSGQGDATVVTEFGPQESDSTQPCTFTGLQTKPGAAWASFSCPAVFDRSSPDSTYCSLDGFIALQDCKH